MDLGSTTIAVRILYANRNENTTFSFPNPQYRYGADIITRIKHCIDNNAMQDHLKKIVLDELTCQLKMHLGEKYHFISNIVISGNTTMQHILRGLSVKGLSVAPFQPVDLSYAIEQPFIYPPGFSAFVGADILVGAQALKMGHQEPYELLIDLGTNGEMLLINKENGFATSTACGPVFDHAISGAKYGSECIHAIARCVKHNLIDTFGTIAEPFFESGISIDKHIIITQQNVRNFQLAKGAILAGIQCLMQCANITEESIATVYLSGGLGFYLDQKDAFILKMFPDSFRNKLVVVGNSSLEGATNLAKYMCNSNHTYTVATQNIFSDYQDILNRTTCYELANLSNFQQIYMESLDF
ncbi:MAG: ASKHA domain-containing protein [Eubacteriales bacterium]|nr:ASKHA domain-containing protein [Eubacteriales bacterium]